MLELWWDGARSVFRRLRCAEITCLLLNGNATILLRKKRIVSGISILFVGQASKGDRLKMILGKPACPAKPSQLGFEELTDGAEAEN